MAPLSWLAGSVSLLAKSFSVLSCSGSLARCTSVLPAVYVRSVKCLTTQASGPPKRPVNGYLRYLQQQRPRQNPELSSTEIIKKLSQEWNTLPPERKKPFEDAYKRDKEIFKEQFTRYQAQLSPEDRQQQIVEMRKKRAFRQSIRQKRELTVLGKPKRARSSFNIFMSENFVRTAGNPTEKVSSLAQQWRNMSSHDKEVWAQLAQDDTIRYNNEMKSWESHMMDIGRNDLVRVSMLAAKKKKTKKKKATLKKKTTAKTGKKS